MTPGLGSVGPTMVLDTSVLVADPDALGGFGDRAIVLPLTVIEELDGLKSRTDEVGWAARSSLRAVEALRVANGGDVRAAVAREGGGTLRVETNGLHLGEVSDLGLDPAKADNRILAACLGLAALGPVVLVSSDAALRIKGAQLGLATQDYVRHRPVDHFGPGWRTIEVEPNLIDLVYEAGQVDPEALGADLSPNEFAVLSAPSQSVLVRARKGRLVRVGNGPRTEAWGLRPRSKEQQFALDLLMDPDIPVVALAGHAGTGKTLLALAAGLEQVMNPGAAYEGMGVYRPVIPAGHHELGFLPGDLDEKLDPWTAAIMDNLVALTERQSEADARKVREELEARGSLVFGSIAHVRGRSIARRYLIVDEAQNCEVSVLKLLLTRVAEGTKIVFTGDPSQIDANYLSRNNNALAALIEAFAGQECFGYVCLHKGERSEVAELAAKLL
ncbi:MAG: PhoH family protein [Acidimicrobiales bacterium]